MQRYVELLRLAKANYRFLGYREVGEASRFVLWRHDCDFSLKRALRLARAEHEESVKCTYFLNPHCEFDNLLEKDQATIVSQIRGLGHDIGLHFDAAYYEIESQDQLEELVAREATWLREWFHEPPTAMSFHNPTEFLLTCERETYGGLLNCYSARFKREVPYVSDSNGVWRFRNLLDVLRVAKDPCLHVLTHPGWWQDDPMPPRQRVFRSSYGRARSNMAVYDQFIDAHGRPNDAGPAGNLRFVWDLDPESRELCDFLWSSRRYESLFIELYRLHERVVNRMCSAFVRERYEVSAAEVDSFFGTGAPTLDGWVLFETVFGESWARAAGTQKETQKRWADIGSHLLRGRSEVPPRGLEQECVHLCSVIGNLANWQGARPPGVGVRPSWVELRLLIEGQTYGKAADFT